jgi:mannose-6-phosphate isomerase-like protein (cupin superfamily)
MDYTIVDMGALAPSGGTREFEGAALGNAGISVILVDLAPGEGPKLHMHPYEEVFIIQEGVATYTIGSTTLEARAGQIAVVPAGVPHKFVNAGPGRLRQVDVHHSPRFITRWLEG